MRHPQQKGVATFMLVFVLGITALLIVTGMVFTVLRTIQQERSAALAGEALAVAEAGAEEVALRISRAEIVSSPLILTVGDGTATVTNSTVGTVTTIKSVGEVDGAQRAVEIRLRRNTVDATFNYGVQVGDGGIELENGASIEGNVGVNGSIIGAMGAKITGDAFVARNTPVVEDQKWEAEKAMYIFGQNDPVEDVAQQFVPSVTEVVDTIHLYLRRIGTPGDITLRLVNDDGGEPSTTSKQNVTIAEADVETGSPGWVSVSMGSTTRLLAGVPYWIVLDASINASDYYQWGSDTANGYANGIGMYSDRCCQAGPTWVDASRDFNFRVFLGGAAHLIDNVEVGGGPVGGPVGGNVQAPTIQNVTVHGNAQASGAFRDSTTLGDGSAPGDVHADIIENCTIAGDAQYNTEGLPPGDCTIGGMPTTPTTPPTDPEPLDFPVADSTIQGWKDDAAAGGTWEGDCIPDPGDPMACPLTLGPIHITGDLLFTHPGISMIIEGTVWVDGNIDIENSANIRLSPSYGENSGVVLSDGWIHIGQNGVFGGSGDPASFLMFLTTLACTGDPEGVDCGHHDSAMDIHNNAEVVIFYAANGLIYLHQNIRVTEIVGWKVHVENNSEIIYDQGLANAKFSSGPSGGYTTLSWEEVLP